MKIQLHRAVYIAAFLVSMILLLSSCGSTVRYSTGYGGKVTKNFNTACAAYN